MRLLCRFRGHRWADEELIYRTSSAYATIVGKDGPVSVTVTWCRDAVCSRCGSESWFPT